jgi:hypothetical protein
MNIKMCNARSGRLLSTGHEWFTLNLGSYIVHLARRLFVVVSEASHRRHVILVFAFRTCLICCIPVRVPLDVFYQNCPLAARHFRTSYPLAAKVLTPNFGVVCAWFPNQHGSSFAVERIGGVGVSQELREENLEDVDHIEHWRPGLVDDVETY